MGNTRHQGATQARGSRAERIVHYLVLTLLLGFTGLTIGCGTASQSNNNSSSASNNQLKVSTQAGAASVGVPYNAVVTVSGGVPPYTFSISSGSLPPGTSLNATTGSITGIPTVAGIFNFVVSVKASAGALAVPTENFVGLRTGSGPTYGQQSNSGGSESGSGSASISVSSRTSGPTISISPSTVNMTSQGLQQFTAKMSGSSNTSVSWSASVGTISSNGVYSAPKVSSTTSVVITATSTTNPAAQANAAATVSPVASLAITDSSLPEGNVSTPYLATLSATGGVAPYRWSISSGTLPSGIQLQTSSGAISGMTALSGSYPFTAKVTDAYDNSTSLALSLVIASTSSSGFDGPAQLPLVYIQTAMAVTPAPGITTLVNAGGDLQSALNDANCGDTIQLQSGATFTGTFTFPAKSCDDNHWIIVRTSSPDSALPAEGTRMTPCYAGVSSLPGRPVFQCTSAQNVLSKLVMAAPSSGPIVFASGANHYRLIGLEVTRTAGIGVVYELSSVAVGGTSSNIIFDRLWMHGTAQDDTNKGVEFGGSSYISVIDSYFTDFHCVSITGACIDGLAIGGGEGNPVGPFKITDNFLEASGENVIFGGSTSTTTPADIQISSNHFFKPMTWMKGQPGYVGGTNGNPFIVKNLLELKNAQRVLIEANIMEDSWGGFSQDGFAVLITPKNQAASRGPGNLCPICQVTDVTIRYSTMSHLGAGLQIANALSDNGGAALDGERYSIHDITIDDINATTYTGTGKVAEILTQTPGPLLQNVSINHVTAFGTGGLFTIGGEISPQMANFNFTNSIYLAGPYPIWSTGGGTTNCAYYDKPLTTINACFNPYSFASNAIIATPSAFPSSLWPNGNFFPVSTSAVGFVNYNNGDGGNYQLLNSSPYHNAGTDGKDLGADIVTINSEITGVY